MNHEKPELSRKNAYYIPKHRYYELKHFCLQYPDWKRTYSQLSEQVRPSSHLLTDSVQKSLYSDRTPEVAIELENCRHKILLVENASRAADVAIGDYILKGVTEGLSYDCLAAMYEIPCGKDMYYDRYRKFFWYLSLTQ